MGGGGSDILCEHSRQKVRCKECREQRSCSARAEEIHKSLEAAVYVSIAGRRV
jgi:hypothetical protein